MTYKRTPIAAKELLTVFSVVFSTRSPLFGSNFAAMSSSKVLLYEAPTANTSIRINLLPGENPEVVTKVLEQVDLTGELVSTLGHVVVSGQGIWLPTRIVHLGVGNMVKRTPGTVYLNAVGQSICLTYGEHVTESSPVNKFAQVIEEDLPKLEALGRFVYSQTIETAQCTLVPVKIRRYGTQSPPSFPAEIVATPPEFKGHWTEAVAVFEAEIRRIWTEMPTDVQKISLGISNTGAGTGGQMLSVLVHAKAFTMTGADILYRFMKSTEDEDMTVPLLKRMTHDFLFKPFNIPEFMTDLGLENMHKFGDIYVKALETVTTFDDYLLLSGALMTYFTRTHRWIHHIFPWHLGRAVPHRDTKELIAFTKILAAETLEENRHRLAGTHLKRNGLQNGMFLAG